jgi:SAM-dependent methyltransferase
VITITLLEKIEHLLPSHDAESVLRRRVVRLLADAGGQLSLDALHAALGPGGRIVLATIRQWDGLQWSTPRMVRLAPWVRRKLEMDDLDREVNPPLDQRRISRIIGSEMLSPRDEEELRPGSVDSDSTDPLADVRAALARATNIATVAEALASAYPETSRFGITS